MNIYYSLGFTKHTETLLSSLNAQNLIKNFKKSDVSTNDLHKLTKEDFMQLGADETQAENLFKALHIEDTDIKSKHEILSNKVNILKIIQEYLEIAKMFIKYNKYKISQNKEDYFLDEDENLRASQILSVSINSLLKEIDEAALKLNELKSVTIESKKMKRFYIWYYIPIGISLGTSMLLYLILKKH